MEINNNGTNGASGTSLAGAGGAGIEGAIIKLALILDEQARERADRLGDLAKQQDKISAQRKKLNKLREMIEDAQSSSSHSTGAQEFTAKEIREIEAYAEEVGVDLSAFLDPIKRQMVTDYNKNLPLRDPNDDQSRVWGDPKGARVATDSGAMWDYDGDGRISDIDVEFENYQRRQAGIRQIPLTVDPAGSFDDLPDSANYWVEIKAPGKEHITEDRQENVANMIERLDERRDTIGEDSSQLGFKMRKEFNIYSTNIQQASDILKIEKQTADRVGLA